MKQNPSSREAALVIVVGLVVLYLLHGGRGWLVAAVAIGLAAVLSLGFSRAVDWFWNKLSQTLGVVSNAILLTIVFVLVLTPIGLVRRWTGRKGMMTKGHPDSNFSQRDHLFTKKDLENTW